MPSDACDEVRYPAQLLGEVPSATMCLIPVQWGLCQQSAVDTRLQSEIVAVEEVACGVPVKKPGRKKRGEFPE